MKPQGVIFVAFALCFGVLAYYQINEKIKGRPGRWSIAGLALLCVGVLILIAAQPGTIF